MKAMNMNNKKMITEFNDEQIDELLKYTAPYTEQNAANIKTLALAKIKSKKKPTPHKYRWILITAAMILLLSIGASAYYISDMIIKINKNGGVISESMDYQFVLDKEAIGEWEVVDFVRNISDFEPGKPYWESTNLFWLNIIFFDDGTAVSTFDTGVSGRTFKLSGETVNVSQQWTKGYIVQGDVIPSYSIKNIDGADYMFVQWKSGDYTIREMTPCYYVFKKISSDLPSKKEYLEKNFNELLEERRNDNANITINRVNGMIYDTMDYNFVLDEEAVGKWDVVDFVRNIDDFEAGKTWWGDTNFYWLNVMFLDNGTVLSKFDGFERSFKWTTGYILMNDTIPSYTIKNIDGSDYMFIQWKSGDYTIRGMKPCYYVFKRADE